VLSGVDSTARFSYCSSKLPLLGAPDRQGASPVIKICHVLSALIYIVPNCVVNSVIWFPFDKTVVGKLVRVYW